MSTIHPVSGKILPKVLRRAHGIPEPSFIKRTGIWESAEAIEETLADTAKALQEIQRQIQKGEETYFEETTSHANIFKGWDAFLDVRLEAPAAVTQVRRMPADYKWMSSSSVRLPQHVSLPSVSLESAQGKKKREDKKATIKSNAEEIVSEGEEMPVEDASEKRATRDPKSEPDAKNDASKKNGVTPSVKRKDRPQEKESQKEEPTPTPRRTKRSKRSSG